MARRRPQASIIEILVDVASVLPWQVSVIFAVAFYLGLHYIAGMPASIAVPLQGSSTPVTDMARGAFRPLAIGLATFLQYLLPGALLIGAVISIFRRRKRETLLNNVKPGPGSTTLNEMSWSDFEVLVGEAFRRKGYSVTERGGNSADGGIDLELRMGKDRYLVQCKHWKTSRVGVATVRELYGVMAAEGAVGGFVVAGGGFTAEAARFAEGRSIKLLPAIELVISARSHSNSPGSLPPATEVPRCPDCGEPMIRRVAKKGASAGREFWGCRRFPQCRGVVF